MQGATAGPPGGLVAPFHAPPVHIARRYEQFRPDGYLYCNMEGITAVHEVGGTSFQFKFIIIFIKIQFETFVKTDTFMPGVIRGECGIRNSSR